jgi:glucokinase
MNLDERGTILALEIGGTKLQLVAGDEAGQIYHRVKLSASREHGAEGLRRQLETVLLEWKNHPWRAAGIGFGGPVIRAEGRVHRSLHVSGWNGFPLADWLRNCLGKPLPVAVENDTNLGALAEAKRGAGQGRDPVLYVNNGSGVGGGLFTRGRLFHGAPPSEVEVGHLRLDRDGTIVEDRCSGWAIDKALRAYAGREPTSALAQLLPAGQGGEARYLEAALQEGDEGAATVLREAGHWMGFALSHAVQLFHPEMIVLGGGIAHLGEIWRKTVEEGLDPHVMEALRPAPEICLTALREDAVPVGALLLAGGME